MAVTDTNKKPRAIGYVRVSTKDQATNGVSIDMQKEKIKQYCDFYDMELVDILEDAGKSGKTLKRPAAQELIKMVDDKTFDALVIYKLDRLGRSVVDLIGFAQTMEKKEIALHSISEKLDTTSSLGRFFFAVLAALAQLERDIIAERTTEALQLKIARGEKIGAHPPVGKMFVGNMVVDDPYSARVLDYLKEWRDDGYSLNEISLRLAAEGFLSSSGKPYCRETLALLLKKHFGVTPRQSRKRKRPELKKMRGKDDPLMPGSIPD